MTGPDEHDPFDDWQEPEYPDFPPELNEEEVEQLEWLESQTIPDVWFPSHIEQQQDDVDVDENASKMEAEILREKQLANDETDQRLIHQKRFFYFALVVIGFPVLVGSLGFGLLAWRGDAGDATYAAFFASVVAYVIGLSYILGNYFFPNMKNNGNGNGNKNDD